MPQANETEKPAPEDNTDAACAGKRRGAGRRTRPKEIGGPEGPEPTRYGDWERNGRCSDF